MTWSLTPSAGTIVNGLYTAPATISVAQTITLTVTSQADPTKGAAATISLTPTTSSLSVGPAQITLSASQSQQFSATLTTGGAASTPSGTQWSISPAAGSITQSGLYTAPSSISGQQTVAITAVSSGLTATALVSLAPAPASSAIMLPLEVIGPNGTTVGASFNISSSANVSGPMTLFMQINGLRFQTQASVQLNASGWLPINSSTVTLLGLANAYGGIGGGFHTLQMTMNLPAGVVNAGTNTITFRFNGTDGRVSGFRVLQFNVQDASGNQLVASSSFAWTDPNSWQPPSSAASDISAGQTLWRTARLTVPTSVGAQPILAHCMDCHTQDGRDLKYFNYSNNSIIARSMFHGLSAQQGSQIASYIRSLNVSNPGRPWNPPYQPGPGLDSQPVDSWSAGAGLSAVLSNDESMTGLFPGGVQSAFFSMNGVLGIREAPIDLQLPDWNSWLPAIHPVDAFSDFATSVMFYRYGKIRSELIPGNAASYAASAADLAQWGGDYQLFMIPKQQAFESSGYTATTAQQMYSLSLWLMVKSWELNHEFALEGMATTVFTNPKAEPRAWLSGFPFFTSPNMLGIPKTLLDNGLPSTWTYLAFIWYQMQIILNNSEYAENGTAPIDWPYAFGEIAQFSSFFPQPSLMTIWLTKGLQISMNGLGPNAPNETGWNWLNTDVSRLVSPGFFEGVWNAPPPATRAAVFTNLLQTWLSEVQQFSPQQFAATGISLTAVPVHGQPDSSNWIDRIWYMIPQFRYYGVNQALINQTAAWAQTMWPNGNWAATTTATCVPDGSGLFARCSTEQ
ncbi:MAG TPA: hypothetical protein VEV17_09630 [Bryobacteraceae bacterium]|nr:hypothetical protein [Bryobacteraceae bacterium]